MERWHGLGAGAELHTRFALVEIALLDACGTDAPALIADLAALETRAETAAARLRCANMERLTE